MQPINELLTIDEARTYLRVGKNTMYSLIKKHSDFPAIRLGNQIRIPLNALLIWTENQLKITTNIESIRVEESRYEEKR